MEEKTENLWHKSWPGFSAPQIYSEEMETTSSYETVLDSDTEEDYFSCKEDLDMEDDSREAEIQEKGITIQSGLHLLCALSQREDHEKSMGPCPSQSTDIEDTISAPLSQNTVPEVTTGTGPSRDTESSIDDGPSRGTKVDITSGDALSQNIVLEVTTGTGPSRDTESTIGHGPSHGIENDKIYYAPKSQNIVLEVTTGTGPSRENEGTIGDGPSQDTEVDVSFGGPVPPCLYPEVVIIPAPPWESEESLYVLPSWREEREDTEGILPSPNEDNLHGETNQNPQQEEEMAP